MLQLPCRQLCFRTIIRDSIVFNSIRLNWVQVDDSVTNRSSLIMYHELSGVLLTGDAVAEDIYAYWQDLVRC
jgi:hypothetical protein